ncbi:MAG: hypothetical protein AUK48_07080 [Oscillatoriales cyanobacterium CG2_30_44_21]|nr:MAG: hypothetical protein AUK48_07080 [Oscillatoriales cyanobacterium CG2_30_44_21]
MNLSNSDNPDNLLKESGQKCLGGSYKQLDKEYPNRKGKQEIHHMPSNASSPLAKGDGPAILMDKNDHYQTASGLRDKDKFKYINRQKELIDQNGWDGYLSALQMDIDNIQAKFGDKYNEGIEQARAYVNDPESELKQKFTDAVNAKEATSVTPKPESSESTSENQSNETLPTQKPVEISPEKRDHLNELYATSPATNEPTEEEPTKS